MYAVFSKKYQKLLLDGRWGVERELQRVTYEGDLALTPHPLAFGDKLMNKEITTDFAESQMELITPAFTRIEEVDRYLKYLYEKAEKEVGEELLWPLSMPPRLPGEEQIPIARFNASREGQMAYIYRQGLANRYGKKMQMISGIHYNFSFGEELTDILHQEFGEGSTRPEFIDKLYFSAARNYLRYRWLLIYLFGASPSFDGTYNAVLKEELNNVRKCCPECCNQYEQYAVSLRVSRFGYSNPEVKNAAFFNSKEEYIRGIRSLLLRKSRRYAHLEVQLNDNILQKESEFYSPIRLKQITEPGESQIGAIEQRGVKYAEVRILDINPYERTGINLGQMRFLQVFLLFCLFGENRAIDDKEMKRINKNHHLVALLGRRPDLILNQLSYGRISMKEWGENIFEKLHRIAQLLDNKENGNAYSKSVQTEFKKLSNRSLLPSAMMQDEMFRWKEDFVEFGIRKAKEYKSGYYREERAW